MEQCFGFCLSKLFSKCLADKVIHSTIISIYIDFLDDFANSWNCQGCSCTCISDSSLHFNLKKSILLFRNAFSGFFLRGISRQSSKPPLFPSTGIKESQVLHTVSIVITYSNIQLYRDILHQHAPIYKYISIRREDL